MTSKHPVHQMLESLGGTAKIVRLLAVAERDVPSATVRAWKHRCSIPVIYWPRLIALAERQQIAGVTNDTLVAAHAPARDRA